MNMPTTPPERIPGEEDEEYEGLLTAIRAMSTSPGTVERDIQDAKGAVVRFVDLDQRSHEALNMALQAIYTVYVSSRWANRFEETIVELCDGRPLRGVNERTKPIARLTKAALGPKYQDSRKRTVVHDIATTLEYFLSHGISHDKIAAELDDWGGYGAVVAEARSQKNQGTRSNSALPAEPAPTSGGDAAGGDGEPDDNAGEDVTDGHSAAVGEAKTGHANMASFGGDSADTNEPTPPPTTKFSPLTVPDTDSYEVSASEEVQAAIKLPPPHRRSASAEIDIGPGTKIVIRKIQMNSFPSPR